MDSTSNLQLTFPSSSASPCSWEWDVFLSFYGKDTRRNFTSHLYSASVHAGILTFMDEPEHLYDVRAIGICGMGGIGKTTTAKAFYNKYFTNFDISCFVDDVKQHSQGGSYLLPLLRKLTRRTEFKAPDVETGITQLKQFLSTKKALIVLDNLDQSSYSELLVRVCNLVVSGSRIIFTTRDANLVNQLKQDISQVDIYMMRKWKQVDSLELFSYHAFRKPTPSESFKELSGSFITYAGGLPLALKEVLNYSMLKNAQAYKMYQICRI